LQFLEQKNCLDVDQKENFYDKSIKEIEKKNENCFKCVVCNSENKVKEKKEKYEKNEKNEKIKKEIKKFLDEKNKVDVILCENEIDEGVKCNKAAVFKCKNDNLYFCKECNENFHNNNILRKHKRENLTITTQCYFYLILF